MLDSTEWIRKVVLVLTQLIGEDIDWHWKLLWRPWFP